jgi:integrase
MARRRGNGEGAIYETKDGRWRAAATLPDGRRKYVSAATRAEVAAKLRQVQRHVDDGLPVGTDGRAPTVETWMRHWLDNIAAHKVRASTLDGYRSKTDVRILPSLGRHRLDRLSETHVEQWQAALLADGLAPTTVLQCHRILSRSLTVAMQRRIVARNVCTLVDAPSGVREEVKPLSSADARAVLASAAGQHNEARWSVALALGLRQGEALGLAWDCVDLEAGTLTVRRALQRRRWAHGCETPKKCGRAAQCPQRRGGGLHLVPPKSRAGRRVITLPKPLVDALKVHRSRQNGARLAAGEVWADALEGVALLFTSPIGRPIDPAADWKAWHALLRAAGVPRARLHDARHTAASLLLEKGVPARVVMEILGHSQISLTLGTYSHVAPVLQQEAADRMSSALGWS